MTKGNKPAMTKGEKKIFKAKALLADYWWTKSRRDKLTKKLTKQKNRILDVLGEIPPEENEKLEAQINRIIISL